MVVLHRAFGASSDVAAIIDHTLLKPETTPDAVTALVADAVEMGVCSVCVSPSQLPVPHPSSLRIAAVRHAVPDATLKVIIESAVLDDDQIVEVCHAAERAGADFVKTSTGFHPAGGASVHAVRLMRNVVGDRLGVKASGGIRDSEAALAMIAAGATRLGVSSTRAILAGLPG